MAPPKVSAGKTKHTGSSGKSPQDQPSRLQAFENLSGFNVRVLVVKVLRKFSYLNLCSAKRKPTGTKDCVAKEIN